MMKFHRRRKKPMDMEQELKKIPILKVDENNSLFNTENMFYKEFPSDIRQIRFFRMKLICKAPVEILELNLLEQQVEEIILNAIRHGNKRNAAKKVRVWFSFSTERAHLIVEDEGEGFKELEQWNEFHRKRTEYFLRQDFDKMEKFIMFRTEKSEIMDGGNALFAAVEYWNGGIVFSDKRNKVALLKIFPPKRYGVSIESIRNFRKK